MLTADHLRHLYNYHFAMNRKLWDYSVLPLTEEQFTRRLEYSVGSIRNQVVHLLNIDDRWFAGLRGETVPGFLNPVYFNKRPKIREMWDGVEAKMQDYLTNLTDDMLPQPYADIPMQVWQVLLHVVNHATDHRAQTLAMLHGMGAPTFPQDYAIWLLRK